MYYILYYSAAQYNTYTQKMDTYYKQYIDIY